MTTRAELWKQLKEITDTSNLSYRKLTKNDISKLIKEKENELREEKEIELRQEKAREIINRVDSNIVKELIILLLNEEIDEEQMDYLNEMISEKNYIIRVNNLNNNNETYYTLTPNFINRIRKTILIEEEEATGSDAQFVENYNQDIDFDVEVKSKKNNDGELFKYFSKHPINLRKYQIYRDYEEMRNYYRNHCFINSFIECLKDLEKSKIEIDYCVSVIKRYFKNTKLPKSNIKKIAITLGYRIELFCFDDEMNLKILNIYNKEIKDNKISMVLFREHYMPNIKLNTTMYYIENYKEIEHLPRRKEIKKQVNNGKGYVYLYNKNPTVCFKKVLRFLVNNDLFTRITNIDHLENIKDTSEIYINNNIQIEQKEFEFKEKGQNNFDSILFADFESLVNTGNHLPFMFAFTDLKGKYYNAIDFTEDKIKEVNCFSRLIYRYIGNIKEDDYKILMYFHNLKYDFTLFKKCKTLRPTKITQKDGKIYQVEYRLRKNITLTIRDSYKLISKPLSAFGDMFNLDCCKKDHGIYEFYTMENINRMFIPVEEINQYLEDNNIDKSIIEPYINKKKFKHMKFYNDYLKADCQTLQQGLIKFQQYLKEAFDLDMFNHMTISSLGHYVFSKMGCYKGVYEVKSNLRNFISKSIIGGRVCSNTYKKGPFIIDNEKIFDIDYVSLYPSAIKISKFPLGPAKTKEIPSNQTPEELKETIDFYLNKVDFSVLELDYKVNKDQQIPANSYIDENGVRQWSNRKINNNQILNSITIKDLIKLHEIEITKIHRGIYYDEGTIDICQEKIEEIFKMRLKAKKDENEGLQQTLKLILNSIYGKTGMKPGDEKSKVIQSEEELDRHIANHYSKIKKIERYKREKIESKIYLDKETMEYKTRNNDYWIAYTEKINFEDYNMCQIASIILANSKVIVNDMLNYLNDNKKPVYYTDTDSIHSNEDTLNFLKETKPELLGKNLLQLHDDFDSKILKGNIYSKKFIYLGKKCYLDILTDETGETDTHIRFKGCNSKVLVQYCKDNKITIEELYTKFAKGKSIEMDLTRGAVCFDIRPDSVITKKAFLRKFQFS